MVPKCCWLFLFLSGLSAPALCANSWKGIVQEKSGHAVADATGSLQSATRSESYSATTSATGEFLFPDVAPQSYRVSIAVYGKTWKSADPLLVKAGSSLVADLDLSDQNQTAAIIKQTSDVPQASSSNSRLSRGEVSSLPLNERDFSKLLLLAAGSMTRGELHAVIYGERIARYRCGLRDRWCGSWRRDFSIQEVQSNSG